MTEDAAMHAVGHLVGGLNGFTDASIDEFMEQFAKLDEVEALNEVCQEMARTWNERHRPSTADVIARYHAHPQVRQAREARVAASMLNESGGTIPSHTEGQAIANDAYRSLYGRDIGGPIIPTPEYAENLIVDRGRRDRYGNWVATYGDVVKGFRGDQARTRASLDAIGRRLSSDGRGKLTLRPPDEPVAAHTPSPAPDSAAPPPPPPERPQDASGLLSAALGETRRRMEDEQ